MKKIDRRIAAQWSEAVHSNVDKVSGKKTVRFHATLELASGRAEDLERFIMRFRDELLAWNATVDAAEKAKKKSVPRARRKT